MMGQAPFDKYDPRRTGAPAGSPGPHSSQAVMRLAIALPLGAGVALLFF